MPIISIIVPVYKVEAYLRECLDSVLSQTFIDYECILVDDGSPDTCPTICDEYAAQHPQMKVIHKANSGLSDARNVGIRAAYGDYIVLLDSDDLLADNEALSNLYGVIEKTKAPVIFHNNLTIFNDGTTGYSFYRGINKNIDIITSSISFYKEVHNEKSLLAGWLFSLKRTFLLRYHLFFKCGILHEDEHWMPRVICSTEKIAINHTQFYVYRIGRKGSIMSKITPKHIFDKLIIIEELLILSQNKEKMGNDTVYRNWCISLWFSIFSSISIIEKEYKTEYKRITRKLKKFSYLFLYRKKIKDIFLFLLLSFGIKSCQYVLKQYRQFKLFLINHK
jgi:glycosyltransferase involved in cell wall biosynthesis